MRAYVESHKLIEKTYTMEAGYPGFDRAVTGPHVRTAELGTTQISSGRDHTPATGRRQRCAENELRTDR